MYSRTTNEWKGDDSTWHVFRLIIKNDDDDDDEPQQQHMNRFLSRFKTWNFFLLFFTIKWFVVVNFSSTEICCSAELDTDGTMEGTGACDDDDSSAVDALKNGLPYDSLS